MLFKFLHHSEQAGFAEFSSLAWALEPGLGLVQPLAGAQTRARVPLEQRHVGQKVTAIKIWKRGEEKNNENF